jgi:hypothetical protein
MSLIILFFWLLRDAAVRFEVYISNQLKIPILDLSIFFNLEINILWLEIWVGNIREIKIYGKMENFRSGKNLTTWRGPPSTPADLMPFCRRGN